MNTYFICVIVHVQMCCVCAQPYLDQTKKIFDFFVCMWKCFSSLFVSRFCIYFVFQCFKLVFVLKNWGQSLLQVVCDLAESREVEKCICERSKKFRASQKRDLGAYKGTSLLGNGVESPLIFYTKKFECHWLDKEKYNFGKLTLQGFGS